MADPATPSPTPAAPAAPADSLIAAAAAAAPVTPPAAPAATPAAAATPPAAGQPYFPEGMPEALRGKTERETIDNLWKAESERAKPPAAAADYKLDLPKHLEGQIDPTNDKVLPLWREIALKNGMTQQQFQSSIVDLYDGMAKAGLIEKPMDAQSEFATLGAGAGDRAAQVQRGVDRVLEVATRLDALATRQNLGAEEVKTAKAMLGSAASVQVFEKILGLLPKETGPQGGGSPGNGQSSGSPEKAALSLYPSMKVA